MSGGKENKRNSSPIKHQELKSGGKKKKTGVGKDLESCEFGDFLW